MDKFKLMITKDIVLMIIVSIALTGSISYVFYSLGYLRGMMDLQEDYPMTATSLLSDETNGSDTVEMSDNTNGSDTAQDQDTSGIENANLFVSDIFKLSFELPEGYTASESMVNYNSNWCGLYYDSLRDPSDCYDSEGEIIAEKTIPVPSLQIFPPSSEYSNEDGYQLNYGISFGLVPNSGMGGGCPEDISSEAEIEFLGGPVVNYLCTTDGRITTRPGNMSLYELPESSDYSQVGISFIAEDSSMFDVFKQIISTAKAVE